MLLMQLASRAGRGQVAVSSRLAAKQNVLGWMRSLRGNMLSAMKGILGKR